MQNNDYDPTDDILHLLANGFEPAAIVSAIETRRRFHPIRVRNREITAKGEAAQ